MMPNKPQSHESTSLVLLGHGSSKHPGSSRACRQHADAIRKTNRYASVHCGFLKEEPTIEQALEEAKQSDAQQIDIAPYFLAEGYFTQTVIPARLSLAQQPAHVRYLPPLGLHPELPQLLLEIATSYLGSWKPAETSLVLIGHGTNKCAASKNSLLHHIQQMRCASRFAQITDLWLEEPPYLENWQACVSQQQVIFLPYLLAEGQHSDWDIPNIITAKNAQSHPYKITPPLGASQKLANLL